MPKKWRTNVKYIFLAAAFTLATIASANADTTCAVNSPDGELNVRELTQNGPGKVTDKLKNGYTVTMRDFYLLKGKSWARVVDGKTKTKVVGWVFKDYLNCNIQAVTAPPVRNGTLVELKRSGAWTTYTDVTNRGNKVLGMYTANNRSAFYVKYFSDNQLIVQIFKEGWQFPSDGVDVPFSITFDNGPSYPANGVARMASGKSSQSLALVEAAIDDPELAGKFMADLMKADKMTITFEQGDEKPWVVDMNGTREAGTAFMNAMEALCSDCGRATQPYNATKPTQPYKPTAKKNDRDT
jgi:hypothetical protein